MTFFLPILFVIIKIGISIKIVFSEILCLLIISIMFIAFPSSSSYSIHPKVVHTSSACNRRVWKNEWIILFSTNHQLTSREKKVVKAWKIQFFITQFHECNAFVCVCFLDCWLIFRQLVKRVRGRQTHHKNQIFHFLQSSWFLNFLFWKPSRLVLCIILKSSVVSQLTTIRLSKNEKHSN